MATAYLLLETDFGHSPPRVLRCLITSSAAMHTTSHQLLTRIYSEVAHFDAPTFTEADQLAQVFVARHATPTSRVFQWMYQYLRRAGQIR